MKPIVRLMSLFMLIGLVAVALPADAQKKKKKKKGKADTEEPAKPKKDGKMPSEITKSCAAYEGLFTVYQDTVTGKSYMQVKADQLDKEYIYFSFVEDGLLEAGSFRGSYRGSKVISFHRYYDKLEIKHQNTSYYFDENNALAKAAEANINTPIIASLSIEAMDEDSGVYIVSADKIFLSETFQMIKPPSSPAFPSFLGGLSKGKTKILDINSYPANTDISVEYVYDNPAPRRGGSSAATDVRYVSIRYQHSLIEMPDNDYQPRRDDPRIGYFMTQVNDMTSFDATPYRDMIHRWNLVKKDPNAAVSDPVEPITWWIENTTPEEFRPIIKEGVERWNVAFEKAGFSNAVVVKVQPDDADWDAGDIRYNVLRWTSSPQPPFGGYGPSFVNPRTGEILGADIMLEFASIRGRLFREEIFSLAGTQMAEEELTKEDIIADMHRCDMGTVMHRNMMFGQAAMRAMNMGDAAEKDFVKQTLYRLCLHEVGHTLGLSHNMRASTLLTPKQIKDADVVAEMGMCNSVMEYPAINFAYDKEDQTAYYDGNPGFYDMWVIEYGYSQGLDDPEAEERRLEAILSRSHDPKLAFGNDADDMRSPGRGIDPDINIYDLSSDPVAYAVERCELVKKVMPKIKDKYTDAGDGYQDLRNAYMSLTGEYTTQLGVMTRQIGGVHIDRAIAGQNAESVPFTPVSEADQKAAMKGLATYAFAPDAFEADEELYRYLMMQRRGFGHFGNNEDPRIHDRILAAQSYALAHLLHPNVLKRIVDSQEYGNTYELDEYMTDLTDAIFKADLRTKVNTRRQNLQILYVKRLISTIGEKSRYSFHARSMALYELNRINRSMRNASSPDTMTKAHRQHISKLIDDALEGK
ncbi:zinc-dependent metalloprotease [Sanyastnella coralliicola]|uniref:zinc-dependent metalloprotease n=1 Tax=Sanyastnella coralliicola TaxID=3069118 RepID=UPI0027BB19D5|nr:zinc-dependent metalloprotease [Longitalea sp. SCSIO 12813]